MSCSISVTQKEIDENPMFFLYNALYSDEIKLKDMGKFNINDLTNYFENKNLKISKEKVFEFIEDSLHMGLICKSFKGYSILPR